MLIVSYYVYVLLCEDGSYYTGYAKDIDSRLKQHMIGVGARYTKLHRPKRIVYAEEFDTIREAMKREREIKRLSHDEKEKLLKRVHRKKGVCGRLCHCYYVQALLASSSASFL
jgi:putative endonuclease